LVEGTEGRKVQRCLEKPPKLGEGQRRIHHSGVWIEMDPSQESYRCREKGAKWIRIETPKIRRGGAKNVGKLFGGSEKREVGDDASRPVVKENRRKKRGGPRGAKKGKKTAKD